MESKPIPLSEIHVSPMTAETYEPGGRLLVRSPTHLSSTHRLKIIKSIEQMTKCEQRVLFLDLSCYYLLKVPAVGEIVYLAGPGHLTLQRPGVANLKLGPVKLVEGDELHLLSRIPISKDLKSMVTVLKRWAGDHLVRVHPRH